MPGLNESLRGVIKEQSLLARDSYRINVLD